MPRETRSKKRISKARFAGKFVFFDKLAWRRFLKRRHVFVDVITFFYAKQSAAPPIMRTLLKMK